MREQPSAGNLTGSVLVAHPNLRDPNFRRTILFLSHHSADDGAIGLVLNRPLSRTMGELADFAGGPLEQVPVYYGGPVAREDLIVASMQWHEAPSAISFRGFGEADGPDIPPEFQPGLRAFLGYSGWSQGQLEAEIAEKAWIVLPPSRDIVEMPDPSGVWHRIMRELGPVYRLLAEMPDDPSLN
jgi:Putative transcriptional regulator